MKLASMVVEFDTNDKTLSVKMDGEELNNVDRVEFYKKDIYGYDNGEADDEDQYYMMLCMSEKDEENDVRHVSHIQASISQEAIKKGVAYQAEGLPDYVTFYGKSARKEKLEKYIGKYISERA